MQYYSIITEYINRITLIGFSFDQQKIMTA